MLVHLLREHPDELSADMARYYGLHDLRALPARHTACLAAVMCRQPESWTHRALQPDWQWEDQATALAALQADYLALLTWMRTKDGTRGRNKPRPYPRPGADGYQAPGQERDEYVALPIEQVAARLGITTT